MSKRGKGRRNRDDSDEDDSSNPAVSGMLAALEREEPPKKAGGKKEPAQPSKDKAGGKGKKKGRDDDAEDDRLADKMAALMGEDSEDEEEAASKTNRKGNKKEPAQPCKDKVGGKGKKKGRDVDDDAEDDRLTHPIVSDVELSAKKDKSGKKERKVDLIYNEGEDSNGASSHPSDSIAGKQVPQTIIPSDTPGVQDSSNTTSEDQSLDLKPTSVSSAPSKMQSENASNISTPSTTAESGSKGKGVPEKKTKLQLKLEALAKEKERLDKERAVKEAERLEQERQEKLRLEQERQELEAAKRREEEARLAAAAEEAEEETEAPESEADQSEPATNAEESDVVPATMFGDEVVKEYGDVSQQPSELELKQMSGKKLSNKDKRRLAKEQEAKEREAEYNRAALKASMEGAQFAVSQSIVDENDPQWQNALDIIIPSVTISAHNKELLNNSELNIVHGRRYGLVGPNGAGKSTLLKMIAAKELKIPPRVDVLYVEQEVIADDTPAVDAVLKADKERWNLIQEEKKLLKELEKGPDESKDVRLGEIYEQLAQIGGSAAESRARRILYGLGFDGEMQERATRFFSGGWRMRISLARALFMEPTLLMLDEPTNHLDLNAGNS